LPWRLVLLGLLLLLLASTFLFELLFGRLRNGFVPLLGLRFFVFVVGENERLLSFAQRSEHRRELGPLGSLLIARCERHTVPRRALEARLPGCRGKQRV
jgi:hypothetical protein